MNTFRPFWKETRYCPSILLVTEDCGRVNRVKQWLEAEGCQVYGVNIHNVNELLHACRNILFDLIVLNIEASELDPSAEMGKTLRSLYKNLKAAPALLTLPMVVMTACDDVKAAIEKLAVRRVYSVGQDEVAHSTLLQTIEQVHYLTYRYV